MNVIDWIIHSVQGAAQRFDFIIMLMYLSSTNIIVLILHAKWKYPPRSCCPFSTMLDQASFLVLHRLMSLVTDLASLFECFGFECFSHYFLVSLPSYCLDFNAADERSLLEIVLYCISKLAVITSRYFYILELLGGFPELVENWSPRLSTTQLSDSSDWDFTTFIRYIRSKFTVIV